MTEKLSMPEIKDFWTRQATEHGKSFAASWSDRPVIEMEVRRIASLLDDGDRVLDVGCANGWSTLALARAKRLHIRGLDYIPEMIDQANDRLRTEAGQLPSQVSFDVGNILELSEHDESYDKVIVIRVLINLRTWENQMRGLHECVRVLRPGGVLLLSEATLGGWRRLNDFRAEWQLPPIPMPPFNEYLDEERLIAEAKGLDLVDIVNFASTYYVGSRVFKPLLAQALGLPAETVADPNMEWNRFWSSLPPVGDYGTQKLFVFRKK